MSRLALGTSAIGRPQYINIKADIPKGGFSLPIFKKNAHDVLEAAYCRGVRFFDTSPGYGFAESILINWLQRKNDPDIKVATKWGMTYLADFNLHSKVHESKEHSIEKLKAQWHASKAMLPYLKIYQIHSATLETGVLDNQKVLTRLYELKKKYHLEIGLSTTGADQMKVINKAFDIEVNNELLFSVFQSTFNVLDQSVAHLKSGMEQEGRRLIIKETLANGRLFPNTIFKHYRPLYQCLEKLASKYGVGPDAIAIRFCLDSFPGAVCLTGAGTPSQLKQNMLAESFRLQESDLAKLAEFKQTPSNYWNERKQLPWN